MNRTEAARKGGIALFRKRGSEYMSEIGKRGYTAMRNKYDLQPTGTRGWALIRRSDNKVIKTWDVDDGIKS